jgi:hypothetical protein
MKKLFSINIYFLFLTLAVLATVAGCKKYNTSDISGPERLFKPGSVSVSAGQTSAKVTWTNSIQATPGVKYSYTAQFSRDTTFATVDFTMKSDTTGVTATNDSLKVRTTYWVRVKTNAVNNQPESKWAESSHFQISGEQFFLAVRDLEIKETSVTLRFTNTPGLTKITMTPPTGSPFDVALTATDLTAGLKVITGLTPNTHYNAELYAGTKSKGYTSFTTLVATTYTTILNSGADINAAIAAAADGAIIGLNPGSYTTGANTTPILKKTVTLKSTSGNPYDTKILFKEMTLKGTGAGLNVSGIEMDGSTNAAAYFVNCTGALADAELCNYTNVTVDNCYIHDVTTALFRGNRGTAVGDYKINTVSFTRSICYNIGSLLNFTCFTFDKMQFGSFVASKSTFYNFGNQFLTYATTMTAPTPTISVDLCTMNNFGASSKNIFINAGANIVAISMTNSIFGNAPRPAGGVAAASINATSTSATIAFNNNDTFKLFTAAGGTTAVTLPTNAGFGQTVDPGWTATTTDFTLAVGSPLRTASPTSGPIGDPRWAY